MVKQANFKFVKNPPDKRLLYKYFTEIVFFLQFFQTFRDEHKLIKRLKVTFAGLQSSL